MKKVVFTVLALGLALISEFVSGEYRAVFMGLSAVCLLRTIFPLARNESLGPPDRHTVKPKMQDKRAK